MRKLILLFLLMFCFSVHAKPHPKHVIKTFVEITVCEKPVYIYVIDTHGEVLALPIEMAEMPSPLHDALTKVTGKIYNVDTGDCVHT